MSDLPINPIDAVSPVRGVAPARPVGRDATTGGASSQRDVAASTGGSLPGAYAQLVINPDTHDVVIRVRDTATHEIISEYPSTEVEQMAKYLMDYLDTLQRRRAADHGHKS
jgi:hypothetical protein